MRWIKNWFLKLKIKYKMIISMYLVIVPILLFISSYMYIKSSREVVDNMSKLYQNLVNSINENINYLQSDVEDLLTYLCINSDIRYILNAQENSPIIDNTLIWEKNSPMNLVKDMISVKGYIKTMILYPENGVTIFSFSGDTSVLNKDIDKIHNTEIYKKAYEVQGDYVWTRISKDDSDLFINNKSDKIIVSRVIFNYSKSKPLGYLVIGIDTDKYRELLKNGLYKENEGIIIFNKNKEELINFGEINSLVYEYIKNLEYYEISKEKYLEYNNYYIFSSQNKNEDGYIFYIVPKENWFSQIQSAKIFPIIFLVVLLVFSWPLIMLASNIISKPLYRLYKSMEKFKKGDFNQKVEVVAYDEIGEVSACFNDMVKDIKKLIEQNYIMVLREKQSEYDALQAQINPHFLYNTLDSLYWQALNGGSEKLAEDIFSLSQLFRSILSKGESIISVKQEKNLIFHYLQIQKMRFNKKLDFLIDIDDNILEYKIPKLILQPFVENAVVHGLENTGRKGFIKVTGKLNKGYLLFKISDNGIGLTKDQINSILEKEEPMKYSSKRISGYAIKNVKERLRLKYQGNFKLDIKSKINRGTIVIIEIPSNEN
ncbi:sensor histidine kinase [Defluviitalea phaphyphila]|uniref:sensor histidine kinase n=1 Tax=Defluviitalea phaphyphila TaxID=1473580 RepID=UPI0007300E15|nr:sensor histidine kinase [Defluviitalea phaphyphila]